MANPNSFSSKWPKSTRRTYGLANNTNYPSVQRLSRLWIENSLHSRASLGVRFCLCGPMLLLVSFFSSLLSVSCSLGHGNEDLILVYDALGYAYCRLSLAIPKNGIFENINSVKELAQMPQWTAEKPLRMGVAVVIVVLLVVENHIERELFKENAVAVCLQQSGMDQSKITRKQSKMSKHGHENQKSTKAGSKARKVKPQSNPVNLWCPQLDQTATNEAQMIEEMIGQD
ncbi:ATP phosphoribosyltransferase 2, chloroplastic-like protein [Tanacetum coccineum]|uniref:ATP phosphoribosyltransferase 2, chloroplastic-like protein n=1 Tax=Tanacetum coccineum TaxID=301880 RepID=A0ABQ5BJE0_9ASTR